MNQVHVALNVTMMCIGTVHMYVTAVNQTVQLVCHGQDETELGDKYSCGLASKLEKLDLGAVRFKQYVRQQ